jgi:hypothetical protein
MLLNGADKIYIPDRDKEKERMHKNIEKLNQHIGELNPKGNADTKRLIRTIKEDLIWPYDWNSPFELEEAFNHWVSDYNTDFLHQSLNYQTPYQFFLNFKLKKRRLSLFFRLNKP